MTNNLTLLCTNEQGCQIEQTSGILQITLSKDEPQTAVTWQIINQTAQKLRFKPVILSEQISKIVTSSQIEINAGETQTINWQFRAPAEWLTDNQIDRQLSFDYIWEIDEVKTESQTQNNETAQKPNDNADAKITTSDDIPVANYYSTNNHNYYYNAGQTSDDAATKTDATTDNNQTNNLASMATSEPAVMTVKETPLEITGEVLGVATTAAQSSSVAGNQITSTKIVIISLLLLFLLLIAMFVRKRCRKIGKD